MKKQKMLKLGKRTITQLDKSLAAKVNGGKTTGGCTDGGLCTPAYTYWNCTEAAGHCTADCDTRTTSGGTTCFTASC